MSDSTTSQISSLRFTLMQLVHRANVWQHAFASEASEPSDLRWVKFVLRLSAFMNLPTEFFVQARRSQGNACSELCASLFNEKANPLHDEYLEACNCYYQDEALQQAVKSVDDASDEGSFVFRNCA